MNKLLIGLTQQEYELDKDILDFIDFVEIKKINDNNLAELDKHNKLISFHLQRFYDANPQPSRKIYLKYWTSPKAQKIYQKYLKRTLWYSSHITSSTEKWQSFDQGHHSVAITKPFTKDFLLKRMITNILGLKKFLTKPFLLESMDYNSYEA